MTTNSFATTSFELAPIGTRFIALIVDGLIIGAIGSIGYMAAQGPGASGGLLVGLIYTWYFLTRHNGQTPGKSLMKIRVIKADGSAISDGDAVVRFIGSLLNNFFALGWIWAMFDDNNQGWHDKLAKTYVVNAN